MTTLHERLSNEISSFSETRDDAASTFYGFEPWDIRERESWVYEEALNDGVDLRAEAFVRHVGDAPKLFQSGFLNSVAFFRALLAGTQVGKSITPKIETIIVTTGEIPISLRHPSGYDTGIKRAITKENIQRFGRFDSSTGSFIDHNEYAKAPQLWKEWDCGTIKGSGIFPPSKIPPPGEVVWIGTFMRALLSAWWPDLAGQHKIIPDHLIDKKRGNKGYSVQDRSIFTTRDGRIDIITYESGFERFEAKKVWEIILDEEPPDERIVQAALQHCNFLSLVETPYQGMTYTKPLLFPNNKSKEKQVFHCVQYDSPYHTVESVRMMKENMNPWEISARVWGMHSEVQGKPYFDRVKIMNWINKYESLFKPVTFVPAEEYDSIVTRTYEDINVKGLMDITVNAHKSEREDSLGVWRQYEEVIEDMAYVMTVDPAEGGENPDEAADICAAEIWRPPRNAKEKKPVLCASLDSTLQTAQFARECAHALRYYNNALLGAESKRGSANAAFASELKDYPYWYQMTTIQDSTRKPRLQSGFDTNARTRDMIFELIAKWVNDVPETEHPLIPDKALLGELAAAVKGKRGRCDHTRENTLDRAVCFGILLYIWEHSPEQIVCRVKKKRKFGFVGSILSKQETQKPVYLGERIKHLR